MVILIEIVAHNSVRKQKHKISVIKTFLYIKISLQKILIFDF